MSRLRVTSAARQLQRLAPAPWNLDSFIDRVAEARDRAVDVRKIDLPAECGISGAWKPAARRDIIFVDSRATGIRRTTIVLHEIAHMWLGHTPAELGFVGEDSIEAIMPSLQEASTDLVRMFMYRDGYGRAAEADAEYLATLILLLVDRREINSTAQHVAKSLW